MRPRAPRTSQAPRRDHTLSRAEILAAALELIERDGVDALSMRKLAAAVDVEAMSLYNHVANKDAVLDGVTGEFFSRITLPPATDDWRADLRTLAALMRATAHQYPRVATLALTREAVSDAGLAATAAALDIFGRAGFGLEDSVQLVRSTMCFLTGTLIRELGLTQTRRDDRQVRAHRLHSSDIPIIVDAADTLAAFDFEKEFEFGVRLLLLAVEHATRTDGVAS
jgi:TetR/AcrR family transcriptional regulator, tetracycline repressor protein